MPNSVAGNLVKTLIFWRQFASYDRFGGIFDRKQLSPLSQNYFVLCRIHPTFACFSGPYGDNERSQFADQDLPGYVQQHTVQDFGDRIAVHKLNEAASRAGISARRYLKYRKGDARPLWKPHLVVPASRGAVNIE